jgi:protein O-GlcNAc transferase
VTKLVAAAVLLAAGSGSPQEFASLMAQGQAAIRAQEYENARGVLEKAVAMRPSDPAAHYALARACAGAMKYQFAREHYMETLRLAPGHQQALLDLAAIDENTGRFEEAAGDYRAALRAGPSPKAERGLASLAAKQGRTDEAIAMLKKLADADDSDVESRYQLGLAMMQKGDCAAAVPQFQAVLHREAAHLGALFNLGNCLNRSGQKDEAASALDRFQKASREEAERVDRRRRAYFLLLDADKKLEGGDAAAAVTSLQEAVRLNPGDARGHAMLGQALEARGDDPGALSAFTRAADLDAGDPIVQVETGRLLGKAGRFEEAIPYFKRAALGDPQMPEPHLYLAAAYQQLGRAAEAAAEQATYRRLSAAAKKPD